MNKELGSAVPAMHHAVKAALDPYGILNQGKVLGGIGPARAGEGDAPPSRPGASGVVAPATGTAGAPRPSHCQWHDAHWQR